MKLGIGWAAIVPACVLSAGFCSADGLTAKIRLVYHERDGATQVQIAVEADEGLRMLHMWNPRGQLAAKLISRDRADMGQAKVQLETTEPSLSTAREAYPAGTYRFVGWTADGRTLEAEATLSHVVPAAPRILFPFESSQDVPVASFVARWEHVPDVLGYGVETDEEETEVGVEADVAAGATSYAISDGWLRPDTLYALDVRAYGREGNVTVSDVVFRTAR